MPITSQGGQTITAVDESGNGASTSFFTEFGFGNIADAASTTWRSSWRSCSSSCGRRAPHQAARRRRRHRRCHEPRRRGRPGRRSGLAPGRRLAWLGWRTARRQRHARRAAHRPPPDQPGPAADTAALQLRASSTAPRWSSRPATWTCTCTACKTEAAQELQGAEGVQLFQAPATTLSLVLNPAPAPEGKLNPFSIPEVRQAMQYLVDRDFIAQDIYRGLAQP